MPSDPMLAVVETEAKARQAERTLLLHRLRDMAATHEHREDDDSAESEDERYLSDPAEHLLCATLLREAIAGAGGRLRRARHQRELFGMSVRVIQGDCRDVLRDLSAASVQCCVTSPPYFGLRDYGHAEQIGLEASPDEYVDRMVSVFREVRRVLRDDGTLWLNIGDSYAGSRCGPQGALGDLADRSIASQRIIRAADGRHRATRRRQGQGSARHPVDARLRVARRWMVSPQ